MAGLNFIPFLRKKKEEIKDPEELMLRDYLENKSPVEYNDHALEVTVADVKALDGDLKDYVMHFLKTQDVHTELGCEVASIEELLQTEEFTPVTAALFIQWYRRDPVRAAAFLMHHDSVVEIPEEIPECEEE